MSPFETLGLVETATADEVKARWRELLSVNHPDRGGDGELLDRYRKAYDKAYAIASAPKPCNTCSGVGKVITARGFHQVRMPCTTCHGTGVQP